MTAPAFRILPSPGFAGWLAQARASLALTTYQPGKLFLIGLQPDGRVTVFERSFERAMGLGIGDRRFWMGTLYQLWRFEDFLDPGTFAGDHDGVFVPVAGHTTGEVDAHDIHLDPDGAPLFVATRFNCLARLSPRGSFRPVWMPRFIDRLVAEDRCHLNGLAAVEGRPRYVTCLAASNDPEGWRDRRRDGGVLIDVASGEIVVSGLSMPHSPRLYRGELWLLQSGTGEFGRVDRASGRFEPVAFLPGFARGLAFCGDHAVIALSRPRENRTFDGLALNERLDRAGRAPDCGLCVVDLRTGAVAHVLRIEGVVQEVYDVGVLPGYLRPKLVGFRGEEIQVSIRPDPGDPAG